jgi:hypothetical protein
MKLIFLTIPCLAFASLVVLRNSGYFGGIIIILYSLLLPIAELYIGNKTKVYIPFLSFFSLTIFYCITELTPQLSHYGPPLFSMLFLEMVSPLFLVTCICIIYKIIK